MFNVVAIYLIAALLPTYAIHVRETTGPKQITVRTMAGSETVDDAVKSLNWLPVDLARMEMWIVRPDANGKDRILRIDWYGLTRRGLTSSNYELLRGDRLHLQARLP